MGLKVVDCVVLKKLYRLKIVRLEFYSHKNSPEKTLQLEIKS